LNIAEICRRTVDSLIKPKIFFKGIKPERGLKNPLIFLIIVTLITFLFLTYHHIALMNSLIQQIVGIYNELGIDMVAPQFELTFSFYVIAYFILAFTFIMISFLWYYITHLCVRIMGGKHGYDQTYKVMTYSLSADYLTLPAFIVSFISLTVTVVNYSIIPFIIFIVSTILYLIPSFYRLYIRLVGLEKLQEMSKLRAFIAAYLLAYVFVTFALIIIDILLVLIIVGIIALFGLQLPF